MTKRKYDSKFEESVINKAILRGYGDLLAYHHDIFNWHKKDGRYESDCTILSNGIVIEMKGRFLSVDRTKHLAIQKQYPFVDLRFVFQNADLPISKKSTTTCAEWCDRHGFLWWEGEIPSKWFEEEK